MKPLVAKIAANGGVFTLEYEREGDKSCEIRGYSESVFDRALGSGIPCVDFRTMDFHGYHYPLIREALLSRGPSVPLAEWLDDVRARGATITTL